MARYTDLSGRIYGRLKVVEYAGRGNIGQALWNCRCECGTIIIIRTADLNRGHTKSCGCLSAELAQERFTTHGMNQSRTYHAWENMKQRCLNPEHPQFRHYGGRGITICARWLAFENFLKDMGHAPKGKEIDRRDNDGPYSPENCRWATRKEQMNNIRRNRLLTHQGETLTIAQWAERIGISWHILRGRMDRGWSIEKALTHL